MCFVFISYAKKAKYVDLQHRRQVNHDMHALYYRGIRMMFATNLIVCLNQMVIGYYSKVLSGREGLT